MAPDPNPRRAPEQVVDLDAAFRAIVRDELIRAGAIKASRGEAGARGRPTWVDLATLTVVAADCTLVLVLIPSLNNSAVETFLKIVQWTGATLFVAAATWFQEQFLAFTRRRVFRGLAIAALILLLPQKMPFVPILAPRAAETVSQLRFDGDPVEEGSGRMMVTIGSHSLSTTAGGACLVAEQPMVAMRWTELGRAVWRPHVVPVYYSVNALFPEVSDKTKGTTLRITRRDDDLTENDFDVIRSSRVKLKVTQPEAIASRAFVLRSGPDVGASALELPNGIYAFELTTDDRQCLGRLCGRLSDLLGSSCFLEFAPAQCGAPLTCGG